MPWLIALILVAGGLCLAGLAMRAQAPDGQGPVTVAKVSNASNAEIERMLRKIETSPTPPITKMGAMCYDMALPTPVTEYVCPVCGEKTLYPVGDKLWGTPVNGLEELRKLQIQANKQARKREAAVTLDERQFCRKCLPDFTNTPQAVLVVELPDGQEQRTERFSETDLLMLKDFFAGKRITTWVNDAEMPLKNDLPRLRELLGMNAGEE